MNKADIEEWRQSLRFTAKDANEVDELCDLALRGLGAGEPTNREKIYGPLLDKIAGEPQVKPTECPHGVPHRWACEQCDGR